ncbi:hypothetical protein ILUMI_05711 [Ignelater luminosus]|uniref:Uncharacterized protein n=1 Tax=Ignelater luminosus TaxID=2038154 RepID=A0A8K0DAK9_IGNLU|nr:hypothetical protein ILUMI_05711 [Ignelater luminosus]
MFKKRKKTIGQNKLSEQDTGFATTTPLHLHKTQEMSQSQTEDPLSNNNTNRINADLSINYDHTNINGDVHFTVQPTNIGQKRQKVKSKQKISNLLNNKRRTSENNVASNNRQELSAPKEHVL